MEAPNKLGLGVGGLGKGDPSKVFLVYSGIASDARDLAERFGIDDVDNTTLIFASIEEAINACLASRGDHIKVMPGHTETLSSATALKLDTAGIYIEGLGYGTLVPKITLDTADTTTIPVSASDIVVENIKFSANYADIATLFTVTTAKHFTLRYCQFVDTAANMNFLTIVTTNSTNNASDGLSVIGCSWITPDTATSTLLTIAGDLDGLKVQGCYLNLGVNASDLPAIAIVATGKDLTNMHIGGKTPAEGNIVIRLNTANPLLITCDTTTANTGYVANNFVRHLDTAAELLVTAATNIGFFENKCTAAVDKSGFIIPAVDS
uniref:Uncharacterized protein n=1 Tax=viral metagenome TaxID=1070528 RepID=A0A6H1ZR59_9ZZZZ